MPDRFLADCEREALHRSGAIQGHGALLVLDATGRVSHVSANIGDFFDDAPTDWLGKLLPGFLSHLIADPDTPPGSRKVLEGQVETGSGRLDLMVTRGPEGSLLLEMTPQPDLDIAPIGLPRTVATPPGNEKALLAAHQDLTELVARQTGFQRVMYYAFREDGDGEVIAETRQPEAYGSYLGLRFPASDIPQIARTLYVNNPWRLIPDATVEPVPLLGLDATPPDLTWSDLRSVSPVHRVYLGNMGVVASLSFPVVVNGTLQALVAAHHRSRRQLPLAVLGDLAARVRDHAFICASHQSQRRIHLIDGLSRRFARGQEMLQRHGDLFSAWPELGAWLLEEFNADGATLCSPTQYTAVGLALEPAALNSLDEWFCETQENLVWSSDSLSRHLPGFPLSETAGVLALRFGGRDRSLRIYMTRAEYVHEVAWGGNPDKPVERHDGQLGISPRRSFEKWVEKRMGYSRAWDNETRLLALKLRDLLLKSASESAI